MSTIWKRAAIALAATFAASGASAQVAPSIAVVSEFQNACATGELTLEARRAAFAAAGWSPAPADGVSMASFNMVPAIQLNFSFGRPLATERFVKQFEGQNIHGILANYDPKNRYPNLCAVIVPGVKNLVGSVRYAEAFSGFVKTYGLKTKSTDLPHYFELSGKLEDGRPARADIFSRSQVLGGKDDMHMTFAF